MRELTRRMREAARKADAASDAWNKQVLVVVKRETRLCIARRLSGPERELNVALAKAKDGVLADLQGEYNWWRNEQNRLCNLIQTELALKAHFQKETPDVQPNPVLRRPSPVPRDRSVPGHNGDPAAQGAHWAFT